MGKEFIVKGAKCMCQFGSAPGVFTVLDNTNFYLNGQKLAGTTMSLGSTFDPPGFGVCKVNPMFPKPCAAAITKWSQPFTGLQTFSGGNLLTESSKATCATGGPDCITVVQTGQVDVPGTADYQKAVFQLLAELDPAGAAAALTEHQIPFATRTEVKDVETEYRVRGVQGEERRGVAGQEIKYWVTLYNVNVDPPLEVIRSIKWCVEVGGKKEELQDKKGDVITLKMKKEWVGKEVKVMPFINSPTNAVCFKTEMGQWRLPIIIDRYKMPGLNEKGTNIAKDMCYGFGVDAKEHVYSPAFVQQLIDSYNHRYENKKLDSVLSNSEDYDSMPPLFNAPQPSLLQNIERQIRIKNAKATYAEKDMPEAVYNLKGFLRAYLMPVQTTISTIVDLFKSDEQKLQEYKKKLFDEFRGMVNLFFTSNANPEMRQNIMAMIDKFQRNEGGVYESELLTKNIENHPSTIRYCKGGKNPGIEKYIHDKLKEYKGDVSKLSDETVYFITSDSKKEREDKSKNFSKTPLFPGDIPLVGEKEKVKNASEGYTIALNDIWATEVAIMDYELDGNNYKVKYRVTLWDHFGLDLPDIQPWKFAGYLDGFRAWFVLQHFLGYKPFITKITFTKEFKGSL